MNILIVYPPCRESNTPLPPLGLLYVAQPLIENGHKVKIFDIALEKPNRDEVISRIKSEKFDLMIIGGIITTYSYVKWFTKEIKKIFPDIPIMGGGFVASPIPHVIFKNTGIDVICNGEGDLTVNEYVSFLETGGDISKVQGLFIKKGDSFISTPERELIKDLDTIHPPSDAYKLLDIERYILENGKATKPGFEMLGLWDSYLGECRIFDLMSGRGCVARCTFCYRMMKGIRKHSVSYVLEHMKYLSETYKINLFQFIDELFVTNKKWVDDFCDQMKESNMDVRFIVSSRANMITEELLTKLQSVGCIVTGFGFESASQNMLDSMRKNIKLEDNYNAYKLLKKHNMFCSLATIQGMPGETKETLTETMKFFQDFKIESAACYYVTPYPNSEIYQYALKEGLIEDEDKYLDWISNSDASEFKINLTRLSDSDLLYYHWLLADVCRKNKFQNQFNNNKIGFLEYYSFFIKHYCIRVLYKINLFKFAWNLKNDFESKKKAKSKI